MILILMVGGPHAEGDHRPGSLHHQDQDHCSPREEVLRLDRRLHPGFPLHLPAEVDLQAGVRRVRPLHRPQEVLLNVIIISVIAQYIQNYLCYISADKYTQWVNMSKSIYLHDYFSYFVALKNDQSA